MGRVMAFISIILLFMGCSTNRQVTHTLDQFQDSTHSEVVRQTYFVTDTVIVEIPAQTAERTTADSVSQLENDYATSEARINPDGTLYHDLRTKPQDLSKEVQTPVQQKDNIVYRYKYRDVVKKVEVERELTWIEQGQIYGFRVLAILFAIGMVWKYRKAILTFIRKII